MLPVVKRVLIISIILVCSSADAQRPPPAQKTARKGWLGIQLAAATPEEQKALRVTRPVPRVVRVFKRSPAETSGVKPGDFVLSLNGRNVESVKDLVSRVGAKPPGTLITVVLRRQGKPKPVVLKVVLDLRLDMRDRFRKEWLGRKMPKVSVAGVRSSDGAITLHGAGTAGKITVVDYWATWCGPCKRVMPELEQLQLDYARHGVQVVGVSSEKPEVVAEFLQKRPLIYRVGVDAKREFASEMVVSVLPTVWIIDKQGVIQHVFFGAGHHDKIVRAVRGLAGLPAKAAHRDYSHPSDPHPDGTTRP